MLDDNGFEIYEENPFPLAYLLTFRTYGSWLHGDERISYGRLRKGLEGSKAILPNVPLEESMRAGLKQPPVELNLDQRKIVGDAIKEVCDFRVYSLRALNVRSDHAHIVTSASVGPEKIVNEFKAYATRRLRKQSALTAEKVWSRGASTRYLWKSPHVAAAVDYVLYCQEDIPFEFREG